MQRSFQAALSDSPALACFCAAVWVSVVSFLIFLLWDLTLLRSLSAESRELNRLVYLDDLTSIPNRHCLDKFLADHIAPGSLPSLGCCMLRISNLDRINTPWGAAVEMLLYRIFLKFWKRWENPMVLLAEMVLANRLFLSYY